MAFWDNNTCGHCGFKSSEPLEKKICLGEQEGLECCMVCGFVNGVPDAMKRTKKFIRDQINSARSS